MQEGAAPAVGWGILGVGAVCEVKSGPALYKARGSKLVAVMRRDAEAAADFARRHSGHTPALPPPTTAPTLTPAPREHGEVRRRPDGWW